MEENKFTDWIGSKIFVYSGRKKVFVAYALSWWVDLKRDSSDELEVCGIVCIYSMPIAQGQGDQL